MDSFPDVSLNQDVSKTNGVRRCHHTASARPSPTPGSRQRLEGKPRVAVGDEDEAYDETFLVATYNRWQS